ncbi:UNVERIFIED_CONTAM: hypothetical protein HDU68_000576 [Siphonaria sp. JEL0065]|nr:hypothetical protein HDU68_000576 [Siphonaria sp. JEL0065]
MTFTVHTLTAPFFKAQPLFSNSGEVTFAAPTLRFLEGESGVFSVALKVSEFCIGRRLLVYVEKIDSSGFGLHKRAGAARALVANYVADLVSRRDRGISEFEYNQISIHVFARAQPQYLFADSAWNSDKRILTDSELVSWWAKTLTAACKSNAAYFAFVPGENALSVSRRCGPIFHFGFGFGCGSTIAVASSSRDRVGADDDDATSLSSSSTLLAPPSENAINEAVVVSTSNLNIPARPLFLDELVPRFPDDAKTKAISLLDRDASVMDLMTMLEATGECSGGRIAGFFGVYFNQTVGGNHGVLTKVSSSSATTAVSTVAISTETTAETPPTPFAAAQEFTDFEKLIMKQNFSSLERASESTQNLLNAMKNLKQVSYTTCSLDLPALETTASNNTSPIAPAAVGGASTYKSDPSGADSGGSAVTPVVVPTLVNSLQGLIKKKKRGGESTVGAVVSTESGETESKKLKL